MYSDKVIDHFQNPRNVGEIEDASGVGTVGNAKCGDMMRLYLKINEEQVIIDCKFKTYGCGAAVASSSMATEMIKGKTVAEAMKLTNKAGESVSLPELMDMDINTAVEFCKDMKTVSQKLNTLKQLGLGYLTLGEETPSLSGGEAQRLKLASEIGKIQSDSVFVFDEPSIGLHPLDVQVLLKVFQALLDNGATVIVIEHDLDVIRNADYVIDMGPGGGENGGKIIASGTPQEIKLNKKSITGRYL